MGGNRDYLRSHLAAYHFKVKFGCFGHLREKCLELGPPARNFLTIHETLSFWGSLTCRIKTQHQSHHRHAPRALQLAAFRKAAYSTSVCSQKLEWFLDLIAHTVAKNLLLLSSPRALRVYSWSRPPPTSADSAGFSCLQVKRSSVPASQNQRKNSRDLFTS